MPLPLGRNRVKPRCLLNQERHWKNECSQWVRDSQKAPQTRGRDQAFEGKYQPTYRGASPREENIVGLAVLEGYEEVWDRPGSILLGTQQPMVLMKIGDHSIGHSFGISSH
jgi:hypothetical protein